MQTVGKIVVITGAGSGLGRATARVLLDQGHRVVLAGRRPGALTETAGGHPNARVTPTDVTDPASAKALFDDTVATFGRVDVLFNNAGVFGPSASVAQIDDDGWLWGRGAVDMKGSIAAFVGILNGGAVTWKSLTGPRVACSTTEAEYVAGSRASDEALWLRRTLSDINVAQKTATPLYTDNRAVRMMSKNPVYKERTKHIDYRAHALHKRVADEIVRLIDCPTSDMLADPHFAAREAIIEVETQTRGPIKMQGAFPKLSATPSGVHRPAPAEVGQHNAEVYGDLLGLDAGELADMQARGII